MAFISPRLTARLTASSYQLFAHSSVDCSYVSGALASVLVVSCQFALALNISRRANYTTFRRSTLRKLYHFSAAFSTRVVYNREVLVFRHILTEGGASYSHTTHKPPASKCASGPLLRETSAPGRDWPGPSRIAGPVASISFYSRQPYHHRFLRGSIRPLGGPPRPQFK